MSDIYIRAMRGELPDDLTLGDLAQLRASDIDGPDSLLSEKLLHRMMRQAEIGRLTCVDVKVKTPTNQWRGTRPFDQDRDSPLDRGKSVPYVHINLSGPADVPVGAERVFETHVKKHVTVEQARELFAIDPAHWSEASQRWAGVFLANRRGKSDDLPSGDNSSAGRQRVDVDERANESLVDQIIAVAGLDEQMKKIHLHSALLQFGPQFGFEKDDIDSFFDSLDKHCKSAKVGGGVYKVRGVVEKITKSISRGLADKRPATQQAKHIRSIW